MLRSILLSIVAVVVTSAAAAQDIDYEQIFADRASEVEVTDDGLHILRTRGDVSLYRTERDGAWLEWGVDRSPHGAVGCASKVISNLRAVAEICSDLFSGDQKSFLKTVDEELAAFGFANSYPPLSDEEQKRRIELYTAKGQSDFEKIVTEQYGRCPKKLETDVIRLGRNVAANLSELLKTPRFVVANPCF